MSTLPLLNVCGGAVYREWVCVEHSKVNYARVKAEHWWRAMGGKTPVPETVDESIRRAEELHLATAIMVTKQDKYWSVIARRFEINGQAFKVDDKFRVKHIESLPI